MWEGNEMDVIIIVSAIIMVIIFLGMGAVMAQAIIDIGKLWVNRYKYRDERMEREKLFVKEKNK
jgi:hypothetical protein